MNTTELNRAIVAKIMDAFAKGDPGPFREAMTDDFTWRTMAMGDGIWLKAVEGRAAVGAYFAALHQQFANPPQTIVAQRIFADGDTVIVEAVGGGATTKRGRVYDNRYCLVFRLESGRLLEIREYFDTAHANAELDPLRILA